MVERASGVDLDPGEEPEAAGLAARGYTREQGNEPDEILRTEDFAGGDQKADQADEGLREVDAFAQVLHQIDEILGDAVQYARESAFSDCSLVFHTSIPVAWPEGRRRAAMRRTAPRPHPKSQKAEEAKQERPHRLIETRCRKYRWRAGRGSW
ncbi:MAG TPA: hypothetical protein VH164_11710 [Ktedonobacteraceae bacterium]|nr:hypothetical protein [Ktedonobacteraceae bacterium]